MGVLTDIGIGVVILIALSTLPLLVWASRTRRSPDHRLAQVALGIAILTAHVAKFARVPRAIDVLLALVFVVCTIAYSRWAIERLVEMQRRVDALSDRGS